MKRRYIISLIIIVLGVFLAGGFLFFSKKDTNPDADNQKMAKSGEDEASRKNDQTETSPVNMIFTGDVEILPNLQTVYDHSGISGVMSQELLDYFTKADYVAINNEFAFSTRGAQMPDKQYTYRVDPKYVSMLKDMNVSLAGLANNHSLDYGQEALLDTFITLDKAGIEYTGAGRTLEEASKLVKYKHGDTTYGFLAASRVIPVTGWDVKNAQPGIFTCYDETDLCKNIEAAKKECDLVIVMVHWGNERTDVLTDYQTRIAHNMAKAGADIIIGSHPHVIQGMEYYQENDSNCMIFYSLGNFIFVPNTDRTFALNLTESAKGESGFGFGSKSYSLKLVPVRVDNWKGTIMGQAQAQSMYQYLNSISGKSYVDLETGSILMK